MNDEYEFTELPAIAKAQAGFYLGEERLRDYSPERYVIAQTMGMIWPYLGEEGITQMQGTGVYPGLPRDMSILLWVLRLKDPAEQTPEEIKSREWNTSRAMNNPKGATVAAIGWASTMGYLMPQTEGFETASKLFFDIAVPPERAKFQVNGGNEDRESPNV